jgi:hypothetical protein
MQAEAATFRRIRAAINAAQVGDAVTVMTASTELATPVAARYAADFIAIESVRGVRVTQMRGKIEIGPERRAVADRRSGRDRRQTDRSHELWAERRATGDRRSGLERRLVPGSAR